MREAPTVASFWQGFFGTRIEPGLRVVPHAGLAGYRGVWFFLRDEPEGQACIVSAPPDWCGRLGEALRDANLDSVLSEPGLRATFGDAFDRSIGPSWLGWLPPASFRPAAHPAVRPAEAATFSRLRDAVAAGAWEDAGLCERDAFAWVEGDEVLAGASMTTWADGVAGPGVVSRRPGCGRSVVSAACAKALGRGELVIYQTLRANEPAVRLARALGFSFHASHVAVRLREA